MTVRFRAIHRPALLAILAMGCADRAGSPEAPAAPKDTATTAGTDDPRRTVLFIGTSLTAGYGLPPTQAFPARIQERIDSAGLPFRVVNAGLSGETSAGARRRIDWLLEQGPAALIVVETGANDGLRGLSIDSLRANIDAILATIRARQPGARLVLAGMEALPNLGREYGTRFRAIYPELAAAHGATYLPFLLEGVAGVDALNQADGVHPTAAGATRVANNVWAVIEPIMRGIATQGS